MKWMTLILAGMIIMVSCDVEERHKDRMTSLERTTGDSKYQIGLLCMEYILKEGGDPAYATSLSRKLLDLGFYAEAVRAVETLIERYGERAEWLGLRSAAYSKQHRYEEALRDAMHARELEEHDEKYAQAVASLRTDIALWKEIDSLSQALMQTSDAFPLLVARADRLFSIDAYDAAVYDLGFAAQHGTSADSVYYHENIKALYGGGRRPVDVLAGMLAYFKGRVGR